MKTNPRFYNPSKSNASKKKYENKKGMLAIACLFVIAMVCSLSIFGADSFNILTVGKSLATAGMSIAFLPLAAGIKGTVEKYGIDETDEQFNARKGAAEDPALYAARYLKFLDSEIKTLKGKAENKELQTELEALKTKLEAMKGQSDLITKMNEEIGKANLAIEAMKENGKGGTEKVKSIRGQIEDWVKTNKSALEAIKSGSKANLTPMVVKTNSPMTPANTLSSSSYLPQIEYVPGVFDIVRVNPTFWDYLKKGSTNSASLVWVNKKTPAGAADFIGPGVAKPGVSFVLDTEISVAKKIAVSAKTTTELLDDIPGMETFIRQELEYQLKAKLNTTLMSGTNSSTVPAGIQSLSTTYTLTSVKTQNPNNWDAIIACVAQLRTGNLQGPVTAFVNPADYANMILTKATSQGQLFVPAQTGVNIVEDNNVTAGWVQIGLLDYYRISIYKEIEVMFGWEEDDFTKNLITGLCEMRLHQWFSANHTGAFIYDTFANIKSAITEV